MGQKSWGDKPEKRGGRDYDVEHSLGGRKAARGKKKEQFKKVVGNGKTLNPRGLRAEKTKRGGTGHGEKKESSSGRSHKKPGDSRIKLQEPDKSKKHPEVRWGYGNQGGRRGEHKKKKNQMHQKKGTRASDPQKKRK